MAFVQAPLAAVRANAQSAKSSSAPARAAVSMNMPVTYEEYMKARKAGRFDGNKVAEAVAPEKPITYADYVKARNAGRVPGGKVRQ